MADASDSGPLGLFEVYKPSGQPLAIIVFVHNLGGDSERSWTNFTVNPPFCWPRDALPQDFPRFRIMTFGYHTPIFSRAGDLGFVKDDSRHLLYLLEADIRKTQVTSPIIFVAHSFGGNIVKKVGQLETPIWEHFAHEPQALTHSALSPTQTVHQLTTAILFFGTPHRGSELAAQLGKLSRFGMGHANIDHRELQIINESWLHISHKYTVVSFYETVPTRVGPSRVTFVRREEATLNTPNEMIFALHTTHSDMVKFSSRQDQAYLPVQSVLMSIQRDILESPEVRPPLTPPPRAIEGPQEEPQRINFRGYVYRFGEGGLEANESCSISRLQEKPPGELLGLPSATRGTEEDKGQFYWVHIPLTNTSWVNPCLQSIAKAQDTDLLITDDEYWLSRERKSSHNTPHSRHFEPTSFSLRTEKSMQLVIYLPYIHWDSFKCFSQWSTYLNAAHKGKPSNLPDNLPDSVKPVYTAIHDDAHKTTSLHPRRTLDQFFYDTLPETSSRDRDQVVSKNTISSRGGQKMIMVDQLWLWALRTPVLHGWTSEEASGDTTIFTCFPEKYEEGEGGEECFHGIADLRQGVLDRVNGMGDALSDLRFVGLVLDQAVNAMLSVRNEQSLDFLGVFRMAIGKATEEQSAYFRKFQAKMSSSPNDFHDHDTKREEVKLVLEIADILDELNSIDRLFEAQADALGALTDLIGPGMQDADGWAWLLDKVRELINRDIKGYRKQVKIMMEDARRTKDSLVELLDLQQKEETLREAQYSNQQASAAREQADETAAQSQILFLFTIVTIIFLPLSFFTSYFGMNVTEITGEKDNTAHGAVWRVMGPISGTIIVGLLGAAFYMYKKTKKKQAARRVA